MSSNIIELIAGDGINIDANEANDSITLSSADSLTQNQKDALENDKANNSNKFITSSEAIEKINENVEDKYGPADFPKFFTTSTNYTIPKSGRYRISAVGGGGGGLCCGDTTQADGVDGSDTIIKISNNVYVAKGGLGGKKGIGSFDVHTSAPDILYDGKHGSLLGGREGGNVANYYAAYNGHGVGGGRYGGAGSPLNYKTFVTLTGRSVIKLNGRIIKDYESLPAAKSIDPPTVVIMPIFIYHGGKGYGAGGGACESYNGGCSGYLLTLELALQKDNIMQIIIGAGGAGGSFRRNDPPNGMREWQSGSGAQGAVLLEWISA